MSRPNAPQGPQAGNGRYTETDVEKLTAEIEGATLIDPDFERVWTTEQLKLFRSQEQQLIVSYRLVKRLREDENMQKVKTDIKRCRNAIEYLDERFTALTQERESMRLRADISSIDIVEKGDDTE